VNEEKVTEGQMAGYTSRGR